MARQHKFNVNTSGLTAYVDENRLEIIRQLNMASTLADYSTIESGVKASRRLHFMDTTVTWQTDACSLSPSNTTTLTEKTLTVASIYDSEEICPKLLRGFWAEQLLRAGDSGDRDIPAEISQAWTEIKINRQLAQMNVSDWTGDTASGTGNLNKYDGLLKLIFADGSTIDGNTSDAATATSASNILARMEEMYLAIPEDMRQGAPDGANLKWFLPQAYYDFYIIALRDANLYHHMGGEGTLNYHGTSIELVPQNGLASTNKMVITEVGNFVLGIDGSTEDTFDVWYSQDDRTNYTLIEFKRGWTYKYADRIVRWGLGAS